MTIANVKDLLISASEEHYAVGAFNVTNPIQMMAIVETATERKSPVIIQTSVSVTKFYSLDLLVAIFRTLAEQAPIPVALHLDHCEEINLCKEAARAGYTNIMIDASKQSFIENVRRTKAVAEFCHALGTVTVEGELGTVSGIEDQIAVAADEAQLCLPEEALDFVSQTGVDFLAPAIGTAHGIYVTENPAVDIDRLEKINQLINGDVVRVPLVIHGGSGLPHGTVQQLVAVGGAKVNVSTELKHAFIDSSFEYLRENWGDYNPGRLDLAAKNGTKELINRWIDVIGSANRA